MTIKMCDYKTTLSANRERKRHVTDTSKSICLSCIIVCLQVCLPLANVSIIMLRHPKANAVVKETRTTRVLFSVVHFIFQCADPISCVYCDLGTGVSRISRGRGASLVTH